MKKGTRGAEYNIYRTGKFTSLVDELALNGAFKLDDAFAPSMVLSSNSLRHSD